MNTYHVSTRINGRINIKEFASKIEADVYYFQARQNTRVSEITMTTGDCRLVKEYKRA